MTTYLAPLDEIRFTLKEIARIGDVVDAPTLDVILEQAGRFGTDILEPLNRVGDHEGARLDRDAVHTPPGFKEAYAQFVEGGWNGLPFPEQFGGQALPWSVNAAISEIWNSANMTFQLCPLLTQAAIEALLHHGTAAQQDIYLRPLVQGTWTGAMCLTEPQAGSDVGAIRTRAERHDDHYRLYGEKIYITFGDHDMAENIVLMVLARLPEAPAGTKGISLFIVPKYLPENSGSLGPRNDVRCTAIEHKLGIHGSPTCVMTFGERDGAVGYLVGEEHGGMRCMFTMMNNARIAVGIEGLGIAERAFQAARAYTDDRIQGRVDGRPAVIAEHPDVARMVKTIEAQVAAMRALAYVACAAQDEGQADRVALLTPIVKAWCTDRACEVTSLAIQVLGGLGYIEEGGVAQYYRDARILPIYEGTNGIQAIDLAGRKLNMLDGALPWALFDELRPEIVDAELRRALTTLEETTRVLQSHDASARESVAGAYLDLFGGVLGSLYLARGAAADPDRLALSKFYNQRLLPKALAEAQVISAVLSP
ncbi:MAG: acyl-CoA dehydrogenase [Pseudomonadota bacterium]